VLTRPARGARIVDLRCGLAYNVHPRSVLARPTTSALLVFRASMTGVGPCSTTPTASASDGRDRRLDGRRKIVSLEHIVSERRGGFPPALLKLFAGENTRQLVHARGRALTGARAAG